MFEGPDALQQAQAETAAQMGYALTWHRSESTSDRPAADHAALMFRRAACPHLGDKIGCGCGDLRVCRAGHGRDYGAAEPGVTPLDCTTNLERGVCGG